ncbi:hypothetical protein SNEBB_007163 [Seison nebaliae]|nr:hypothetical protein SNEBB_007163 [Seison nebaliae]
MKIKYKLGEKENGNDENKLEINKREFKRFLKLLTFIDKNSRTPILTNDDHIVWRIYNKQLENRYRRRILKEQHERDEDYLTTKQAIEEEKKKNLIEHEALHKPKNQQKDPDISDKDWYRNLMKTSKNIQIIEYSAINIDKSSKTTCSYKYCTFFPIHSLNKIEPITHIFPQVRDVSTYHQYLDIIADYEIKVAPKRKHNRNTKKSENDPNIYKKNYFMTKRMEFLAKEHEKNKQKLNQDNLLLTQTWKEMPSSMIATANNRCVQINRLPNFNDVVNKMKSQIYSKGQLSTDPPAKRRRKQNIELL